ncbi:hypothetical protein N182_34060 [Sinorhizobium sp. GL2]|nr:hypothetical protein N182_34060 [Sinorhizobium sp. GL2]
MNTTALESTVVGIATFAVGTLLQGVHPIPALIVATLGGLAYGWISDTIDAHCRR